MPAKKSTATKTPQAPKVTNLIAVIETGGKQYLVAPNLSLRIEKLPVEQGGEVVFDKVLLTSEGGKTTIGTPYIAGATITATVEVQGRARKIRILRYHSKTRTRRRKGHRQPFTQIKISQ